MGSSLAVEVDEGDLLVGQPGLAVDLPQPVGAAARPGVGAPLARLDQHEVCRHLEVRPGIGDLGCRRWPTSGIPGRCPRLRPAPSRPRRRSTAPPAHTDLVGGPTDGQPPLVARLAVHTAPDVDPLGPQFRQAGLVALVHLGVVGEQQAGGADGADALAQHPAVHAGCALQLDRRGVLHGEVRRERLDDHDLDLGDEQVREDHHVWRALDEQVVGVGAVALPHRRDVIGLTVPGSWSNRQRSDPTSPGSNCRVSASIGPSSIFN